MNTSKPEVQASSFGSDPAYLATNMQASDIATIEKPVPPDVDLLETAVTDFRREITAREAAVQRFFHYVEEASSTAADGDGLIGQFAGLRPEDVDRHGAVISDTELVDTRVVSLFEQRGYVKEAPHLEDQVEDESRTGLFRFHRPKANPHSRSGVISEQEGLEELTEFLHKASVVFRHPSFNDQETYNLGSLAAGMVENLTFIGEKEYQEATAGIAATWKNYLAANKHNKLCVITEVGALHRYGGSERKRKSDDFLRESILQHFSDEELEAYSGRIVPNIEDVSNDDSTDVRVILLDDWTVSGWQMRDEYRELSQDPVFQRFANEDRVEINLLVASEERLEHKLHINPRETARGEQAKFVPIKAYFKSHAAPTATHEHHGHVTGIHSTVNHDFQEPLRLMTKKLSKIGYPARMPALATIRSPYEDLGSSIYLSGTKIVRRIIESNQT